MRMQRPRLRWTLSAALLAALTLVGLAGATHGPADAVTAIHANVSNAGQTELICNTFNTDEPCVDALNNNGGDGATGVRGGHVNSVGSGPGVYGFTNSISASAIGVYGQVNPTNAGPSSAGVRGVNRGTGFNGIGVWGSQDGSGSGVFGNADSGRGVYGYSSLGTGVFADSPFGYGLQGFTNSGPAAVDGTYNGASGGGFGVRGFTSSSDPNTAGVRGIGITQSAGGVGVWGSHAGTGWGVYGHSAFGTGVVGSTNTGFAGYFFGNVNVTGTLTKAAGSFKIDHPLNPARKYLQHSFVESPEMLNVYNGNVTTDGKGFATVTLPDYFQALNKDFRYQLTVVGRSFARAIVWEEIEGNAFTIRTDEPEVKVSWQVTGVREDAYAKAHRIPVESVKPKLEQGTYLNPELYGQGRAQSVFGAQMQGSVAKRMSAFTRTPARVTQVRSSQRR